MTHGVVDLVEDNAAHRKLMRILLQQAGFAPRTHVEGETALAMVRCAPPVLLVADVQLPGQLDGLALTREIKSDPATTHVPVLIVSARASGEDETRARRAGCDAWLAKPIDIREFVAIVRWLTRGAEHDTGEC